MRKSVYILSLAFALGGLASTAAHAGGGGCNYSSQAKKSDLEAPPPAAITGTTTVEKTLGKALSDKTT
ncbi:MAG: hypothetical protein GKR94_15325 [Gammaproteobacteria bacterium]|nr:hypothetical protein [Gammaproteobacteria bacterium]